MKIREINRLENFLALEKEWNNFLETVDPNPLFSEWEWLSTWWKLFGNNKRLLVLLAEENNKIVGIAPLMFSVDDIYGFRIGKIEFIGTPDSGCHDFILGEKREECIRLFIKYLDNYYEKWTYIKLSDIQETSKSIKLLTGLSGNSRRIRVRMINDCPYISLPKSFDTFYSSLNYAFIKDIKRRQKRLQEKYSIEFKEYSNSEMVKSGMEILFNLHQKYWVSKGETGAFDNPKFRNFYSDVASLFSEKGMLFLCSLLADGAPVAIVCGFRYRSKLWCVSFGREISFDRYGVGNLLILHVLKKFIEEGFTEFSFGRGDEAYKYRWNAQSRKNLEITLTKKGIIPQTKYWLFSEGYYIVARFQLFLRRLKRLKSLRRARC
jgi:CelD/BcsL family acetyltransferase involved in cellulose biosynthesis